MSDLPSYDVIIIGGGPAGSTCARTLTTAGLRVLVIDAAVFPRVKLCAGWLSSAVWDVLEISPQQYDGALWQWNRCHVHYRGKRHSIAARGYFIRRIEFDDYLLRESGAEVLQGHRASSFVRDGASWIVDGRFRARYLVGAGGTHCPVARSLFPRKTERAVGAQELEFEADPSAIAEHRIGRDGEPELLLNHDLRGYAWNIPKGEWLNVGCGSLQAKSVRRDWTAAREFFTATSLPPGVAETLNQVKGHSYYLFHPANLDECEGDGVLLVGDSLGLAQPITAEGILPAVLSGRLCAEAIVGGVSGVYQHSLRAHPVLRDYEVVYRARHGAGALRARGNSGGERTSGPFPGGQQLARMSGWAIARGFAWMFSGQRLPAGTAINKAMRAWISLRK